MNGCTICEELDLTTPEVEATAEDLENYHPEEGHQTPRINPGACISPHAYPWIREGYIS